jgi:hypothetical protein
VRKWWRRDVGKENEKREQKVREREARRRGHDRERGRAYNVHAEGKLERE